MSRFKVGAQLAAGAAIVAAWWAFSASSHAGVDLGLGTLNGPTLSMLGAEALFVGFGVLVIGLWARALVQLDLKRPRFLEELDGWSEPRWVLLFSFLAFAMAALTRSWVLRGAPMTDDETVYEFSARLLLSGRLYVASPEPRLFFDNVFFVNDGKYYGQYTLGWPALLAPAVLLGIKGWANALLSAATVPALWGVARELGGRSAARWAASLFVLSPMLADGAATMMSHTSALFAAMWLLWVVTTRRERTSAGWDLLLAGLMSLLVFVRPGVGVGLGVPPTLFWVYTRARQGRWANLALFGVAGAAGAACFFGVNAAQTGSPWKLAYTRSFEYAHENHFRFSAWRTSKVKIFALADWRDHLRVFVAMVLRLNQDLFGLPLSLVPVMLVRWTRPLALLGTTVGFFLALHLVAHDVGIDSFAPVHVFESAGILVLLAGEGLRRAHEVSRLTRPVFLATLAFAWTTLIPMRQFTVHTMAQDALAYREAVDEAGLSEAVVFYVGPPVECGASHHFVFNRPANDPDLENDVLWLNHLTIEQDRALMRDRFPTRRGYAVSASYDCKVSIYPLEDPRLDRLPRSPFLQPAWEKAIEMD